MHYATRQMKFGNNYTRFATVGDLIDAYEAALATEASPPPAPPAEASEPAGGSEGERLLRLTCEHVCGTPVDEQSRELADISLGIESAFQTATAELRAEIERLMPLSLAVGVCSFKDVPESVYKAWKEPAAYRSDEIHRLREEVSDLEMGRNYANREIQRLKVEQRDKICEATHELYCEFDEAAAKLMDNPGKSTGCRVASEWIWQFLKDVAPKWKAELAELKAKG